MGLGNGSGGPSVLLVGGGLANGLIALRLAAEWPELDVCIVEAGDRLGGVHTWSFFAGDLSDASTAWIEPLIAHRWLSYEVRFPAHARALAMGYASLTSEKLHEAVMQKLGEKVMLGEKVERVDGRAVTLADGRTLTADVVIDGRGPGPMPCLALGFQKFVGLEVDLAADHGLAAPIIMDATVAQEGGYRFLYVLPFGPRRLLIEDTRYTDGPEMDLDAFRRGVRDYAAAQGWMIETVVREEVGVLPVALDGDIQGHWRAAGGVPQSGLRAALFHPTTGYSLPFAVRLAEAVAALPAISAQTVERCVREMSLAEWEAGGFYRLLNRMLFKAAAPNQRYKVLERFYRLPEPLIARFYAAASTGADKLRILAGKPPVPIGEALKVWRETGRA